MANEKNLIPNSQRSPNELREMTSKGGKASGRARARKKTMRETLQALLQLPCEIDGEIGNGYLSTCVALFKEAQGGNVKAFEVIRDTIGEKPINGVSLESGDEAMKEITIAFVDKSKQKVQREQDPKIIGDYTPSVDNDRG